MKMKNLKIVFTVCLVSLISVKSSPSFSYNKRTSVNDIKDALYKRFEKNVERNKKRRIMMEDFENNVVGQEMNDLSVYDGSNQCDSRCGSGPWKSAGTCNKQNGKCACAAGWTGPNSKYVENTIEADYCVDKCHYSDSYRNLKCVFDGFKKIKNHFHERCSSRCGLWSTGKCLSNGRCLCQWGWTGPTGLYVESGIFEGRIVADYCTYPCHYTQTHRNKLCGGVHYKYALVHTNRHGDQTEN